MTPSHRMTFVLLSMQLYENQLFHIYNRGNNSQTIFFKRENYLYFLRKLKDHLAPVCEIISWCLMPNHFHIMVFIGRNRKAEDVSKAIQIILRSYTRAINIQENRNGSLFQQKTKSEALRDEILEDNYAESCFRYIHRNPFDAGLVRFLEDWEFSSYRDYFGTRNGTLINKSLANELLDISFEKDAFVNFSYKK